MNSIAFVPSSEYLPTLPLQGVLTAPSIPNANHQLAEVSMYPVPRPPTLLVGSPAGSLAIMSPSSVQPANVQPLLLSYLSVRARLNMCYAQPIWTSSGMFPCTPANMTMVRRGISLVGGRSEGDNTRTQVVSYFTTPVLFQVFATY